MQTFLPYDHFVRSVACLDYKRLGKQRVEAYQILNILIGVTPNARQRNHPAVLMWVGHSDSLGEYLDACITEWVHRGYNNTMTLTHTVGPKPPWFGNEEFHKAHRSNLLRKDAIYYRKFGWTEPNDLPYIWP